MNKAFPWFQGNVFSKGVMGTNIKMQIRSDENQSRINVEHIRPRPRRSLNSLNLSASVNAWSTGKNQPSWSISDSQRKPKPTKIERTCVPCTKQEWINQFDDFCQRASLHGLKYIGDVSLNWSERIFWIISFIAAIVFSVYYINNLFIRWEIMPVIISLNPSSVNLINIPFPAVTICNMNRARRSIVEGIQNETNPNNETILYQKLVAENCGEKVSDEQKNMSANWKTIEQFLIKVSPPCHEMLEVCYFGGKVINCEEFFNTVNTDDGFCCTFNRVSRTDMFWDPRNLDDLNVTTPNETTSWTPEKGYSENASINAVPQRPLGPGTGNGLTLVLNAYVEDYYCSSTLSEGFKILPHNPVETPKIKRFGLLLSPGNEARIDIVPKIIQATEDLINIQKEKRECLFSNERRLEYYKTYTQNNCILECEAWYTKEKCNCVLHYMPKSNSTPICGQDKEECADEERMNLDKNLLLDPEPNTETHLPARCHCLPACTEIHYQAYQTSSKMTSVNNIIKQDFFKNITLNKQEDSYFRKNMAVVHFYFSKSKFTPQQKGELFGFTEFLSSTGGLLGLFMGFSFLSIVEIFYYVTLRLWLNVTRKRQLKSIPSANAFRTTNQNNDNNLFQNVPYPFTQ